MVQVSGIGAGLMTIKLVCSNCQGNRFAYPLELAEAAIIHCEDCKESVGTVAELREKIISQIASRMDGEAA
jgi:hypothetical protein